MKKSRRIEITAFRYRATRISAGRPAAGSSAASATDQGAEFAAAIGRAWRAQAQALQIAAIEPRRRIRPKPCAFAIGVASLWKVLGSLRRSWSRKQSQRR